MFIYFDSHGRVETYIQPFEMRELILEGSDAYWLGKAGFANLEWRSFGDRRLLQLCCIPGRGFHVWFSTNNEHLVAVSDPPLGEPLDEINKITVGDESIPIERREVITRAHAAEIASVFLTTGLPHAGHPWERRAERFDVATLKCPAIET